MKKKAKSSIELMNEIRREWTINPRTRVKENDLKNKKKSRQQGKREAKCGDHFASSLLKKII